MASLQDQFLKAGLVDKKRVKKVKQEKRKQKKKLPKGQMQVDLNKEQVKEVLAERLAIDQAKNKELKEQAAAKAIKAQIIQLTKSHAIDHANANAQIAYQFTDGAIIKKIYVTDILQKQLSKGIVAIARLGEGYEIIPTAIAEKIKQRDTSAIVLLNDNSQIEIDEDDPYADYQVPDDLMW